MQAKRAGNELTATATAAPTWKFGDFGMTAPSVPFTVVSIVDELRVVVDLVRDADVTRRRQKTMDNDDAQNRRLPESQRGPRSFRWSLASRSSPPRALPAARSPLRRRRRPPRSRPPRPPPPRPPRQRQPRRHCRRASFAPRSPRACFIDEKLDRSDIRCDPATGVVRPGAILNLNFLVSRVSGSACTALSGAMVDVWRCRRARRLPRCGQRGVSPAPEHRRFRQREVHDDSIPGWYQGRAVHIHFNSTRRHRASSHRSSSSTTRSARRSSRKRRTAQKRA